MRVCIAGISFLLLVFSAAGQDYSYARYDVKDGLAGAVAYCGVEDKDGFLWFGTEAGLSRFDGTHFKNFTTADGLPDNEVLRLFVDSKNRIWIRAFRSAVSYYWKGKIYNQQNDPVLAKLPVKTEVLDITEDSMGNVFFIEAQAAHMISTSNQIICVLDSTNIIPTGGALVKAGIRYTGHLGIIGGNTFKDFRILNIDNLTHRLKKEYTPILSVLTTAAWVAPNLEVHVGKDDICFSWDRGKRETAYPFPANYNSISPLNDSLCAINTVDGSIILNYKKNTFFKHCMKGKIVNSVMVDSEGSYWFMTAGRGIFRLGSFEFSNYTNPKNIDNGGDLPVFSLCKDGSKLYVGSEKNMVWIMNEADSGLLPFKVLAVKRAARITVIFKTASALYFATDNGLIEQSKAGLREGLKSASVKGLAMFRNQLYVAMHYGTYLVPPRLVMMGKKALDERATAICTQGDHLYVGRLNGLYELDSNLHTTFLGSRFPVFTSRISALSASDNGILWVGTNGNGIIGYHHGQIKYVFRRNNGLTSDICRSLFVAGNDIWVGTDKGLNQIILQGDSARIINFTVEDGLLSGMVNAVLVDNNHVYVGTPAGLTLFDADKISGNSYCKLRITGISTGGAAATTDTGLLTIPHNKNSIRVEYVGISYRSAGKITYKYRVIGLDDHWQTTQETFLSYPSLPSGKYELQIIASNKFGVNSDLLSIPFIIEKTLWEETWFRITMLLIIAAIIWFFVNARIRSVQKQNEAKNQIDHRMAELEQLALKAQMNPHFIFNSLNSLQHYVIEKDVAGANKFITEFSRLIRLTLDMSTKTSISIYEEISYLTTYLELEKTKFEDKFSYEVIISPDIHPADWYIPPMILQPYVENSIRHGVRSRKDKLGHIKVQFLNKDNCLVCVVEDNGVGRESAALYKSRMPIEYQSKGMTLTAKRIDMLNRELLSPILITIEDLQNEGMATGTRVSIRFPAEEAARM